MIRLLRPLLAVALAALFLPAAAAAHVGNVEYKFPLPVWVYAAAAASAVFVSAPAAAFAMRAPRERVTGDFYRFLRPLHLSRWRDAARNPHSGGHAGRRAFRRPIRLHRQPGATRRLGRLLGRPRDYECHRWQSLGLRQPVERRRPRNRSGAGASRRSGTLLPRLARCLAVGLASRRLVLGGVDLGSGDRGRVIALLALSYFAWQLLGMAVFGAEVWLARCELFTVLARTFARFAPLEIYVRAPAGDCSARRCRGGGRRA